MRSYIFVIILLFSHIFSISLICEANDDLPEFIKLGTEHNSGLLFKNSPPAGISSKNVAPYDFSNFTTGKVVLDVTSSNWVDAGVNVAKNKLIRISWEDNDFTVSPSKYRAMYRIDHRFNKPELFIIKYDNKSGNWSCDLMDYDGVDLSKDLSGSSKDDSKYEYYSKLYNQYFALKDRGIKAYSGDIVNIALINNFFTNNSAFNHELQNTNFTPGNLDTNSIEILNIYSQAMGLNNQILYMSVQEFCQNTINSYYCSYDQATAEYTYSPPIHSVAGILPIDNSSLNIPNCSDNDLPEQYKSLFYNALKEFKQSIQESSSSIIRNGNVAENLAKNYFRSKGSFSDIHNSFASLLDAAEISKIQPYLRDFPTLKAISEDDASIATSFNEKPKYCIYDKGEFLEIYADSNLVKAYGTSFLESANSDLTEPVFSYVAAGDGIINFSSPFLENIFSNFDPKLSSFSGVDEYKSAFSQNHELSHLYAGRYMMEITVAPSLSTIQTSINNLNVEYYIQGDSDPTPTMNISGTSISNNYSTDATKSGRLWVRAKSSSSNINGNMAIQYQTYTGSKILSTFIYEYLVKPVREKYSHTTQKVYIGLVQNAEVQLIATSLATLYVMLYGILFLLGATQIKVNDLVVRIVKIILVIYVLFSEQSWEFFNTYLFGFFFDGADQLIKSISNATSSTDNPFGFLDPIFDSYTSPKLWLHLLVQLLQFWNGIALLAILTIAGIIIFFSALLEITLFYILSFILIHILIGLAPLFIVLIFFQFTQQMFVNWLSLLFKYTIQPMVLIVFILIFDQFIKSTLSGAVVDNKWGCLIDLKPCFNLLGQNFCLLPDNLFCIAFWIPDIAVVGLNSILDGDMVKSSSLLNVTICSFLFFTYSLIAKQLVSYVEQILSRITGVFDDSVSGAVEGIKAGPVGQAYAAITGGILLDKYRNKLSPMRYDNDMGKRLQNLRHPIRAMKESVPVLKNLDKLTKKKNPNTSSKSSNEKKKNNTSTKHQSANQYKNPDTKKDAQKHTNKAVRTGSESIVDNDIDSSNIKNEEKDLRADINDIDQKDES